MLLNVLETTLPDTQTCRVVAYHLIAFDRLDDAVKLLETVRETLAPAQPHSYTDLAFARLHRLRQQQVSAVAKGTPLALEYVRGECTALIADLSKVITGTEWPERFKEIEWPALILLSWAVAWAEHTLDAIAAAAAEHVPLLPHGQAEESRPLLAPAAADAMPTMVADTASLWPEETLPAAKFRLGGKAGPQLDAFVWLGWDTDFTDVDLHVKEPTGEEVYYSHPRSDTTGGLVSKDFTRGYGPEVYTLPTAPAGKYSVETNYYASHQDSTATGSTSAVVWSITKLGRFDEEAVQFASVRLRKHKQRQPVLEMEF